VIDYNGLNAEQREAVFGDHPRILCLAGAGTGKTAVLTHRIARLWETGVDAANILALTFTRAAGAEMKERVIGLIGMDGKRLFCNTFHAFCADVIREFADRLGYDSNFTIYDQREADETLSEALSDLRYKIPAKQLAAARAGKYAGMSAVIRKQAETAIKEYRYRLKRNNALDFDGLIETVGTALTDCPEILAALRGRYKYIFVDEFQDTDPAQWEIVQRIDPENLFVTGDDFQSIYGFRGSDVSIILGLARDAAWKTIKLERNYRSTIHIIAAANSLIRRNHQTDKTLKTDDKNGADVDFREPEDDESEITDIIGRLTANQREKKTTAILARTNKQLTRAKSILTARGVPCETRNTSDSPLSGKGAKELLAWIVAIANPRDDAAMRKIAALRMGKSAILAAEQAQLAGFGTFSEALRTTDSGSRFLDNFEHLRAEFAAARDLLAGATTLVENLGIEDGGALLEIGRWQCRQTKLGEPVSAADLLNYVRLSNFADKSDKERDASKTYLMTVHGSKGLEFDEVFVIGAARGIFPSRGDIEEERRLFYVAITRAREYLNISCPLSISDWSGKQQIAERSQFVGEALCV
jgi:DNA helicase-2/ATP-dependent DNA helicase PcrA